MKEKRKNLLVILGYSNAGKDTILKEIFPILQGLTSHTTRPPRLNEEDGVDYHFIDRDTYLKMMKDCKFLEHREYHTLENGKETIWYYGLSVDEVDKNNSKDFVVILDLQGTKELIKNKPEWLKVYTVFIDVTEENRINRAKHRPSYEEDEFKRRLIADYRDFKGVHDFVDLIVQNNNDSLEESTYRIITEFSKWRMEEC